MMPSPRNQHPPNPKTTAATPATPAKAKKRSVSLSLPPLASIGLDDDNDNEKNAVAVAAGGDEFMAWLGSGFGFGVGSEATDMPTAEMAATWVWPGSVAPPLLYGVGFPSFASGCGMRSCFLHGRSGPGEVIRVVMGTRVVVEFKGVPAECLGTFAASPSRPVFGGVGPSGELVVVACDLAAGRADSKTMFIVADPVADRVPATLALHSVNATSGPLYILTDISGVVWRFDLHAPFGTPGRLEALGFVNLAAGERACAAFISTEVAVLVMRRNKSPSSPETDPGKLETSDELVAIRDAAGTLKSIARPAWAACCAAETVKTTTSTIDTVTTVVVAGLRMSVLQLAMSINGERLSRMWAEMTDLRKSPVVAVAFDAVAGSHAHAGQAGIVALCTDGSLITTGGSKLEAERTHPTNDAAGICCALSASANRIGTWQLPPPLQSHGDCTAPSSSSSSAGSISVPSPSPGLVLSPAARPHSVPPEDPFEAEDSAAVSHLIQSLWDV